MNESKKKVIVIGAGGHSHSVCDILLQDVTVEIVGLIDGNAECGFFGIPLLGCDDDLAELFSKRIADHAFVALGSNKLRNKLTKTLVDIGYTMINAISPKAVISPYAALGSGIAVMPGAVINAGAVIGNGSIINTNCSVDHDTKVSEYVHIAPGCAICGNVSIGAGTFIGVGTSVVDGVSIGSSTMIGAGAAVVGDIPDNCTAVGVPAKVIKFNKGR